MTGDRGGPKATLPVENEKLAALARESVGDTRPTTQMDPAAMRELLGNAVPPIDELGKVKVPAATAPGMAPLARGTDARAPSSSDVVELGADDRKSRKQRALAKPSAGMPGSTKLLLVILAAVTVVALIGWLR